MLDEGPYEKRVSFDPSDANEEQLDFPVLYGSSKQGWLAEEPEGPQDSLNFGLQFHSQVLQSFAILFPHVVGGLLVLVVILRWANCPT